MPPPSGVRFYLVTEPDYTMSWEFEDDGMINMQFRTSNPETFERLRQTAVDLGYTITREEKPGDSAQRA